MKTVILSVADIVQVIMVEQLPGDPLWTVRFRNLTTGATLPDMTCKEKPELYVNMKCVLEVKVIPMAGG